MDGTQLIILEISSKTHSFINHYTPEQDTESKPPSFNKKETESKYNKFVNEIDGETDTRQQAVEPMLCIDDQLVRDLRANGLSIMRCNHLMNELVDNEYDSDAIIDDLSNENDRCNHYEDSQIYNSFLSQSNKYFIKIIKKRCGMKPNDDDKVTTFVLGRYRVMYWKSWKGDCDKNRLYADSPKYRSLKEECIHNDIYSIDIGTFHDILQKAVTYTLSNKGRSIKGRDGGGENLRYEIPINLPISISHIMVLMMYCNLSDLQHHYKKMGCREDHPNEDSAALIKRNQEIGHWYKLLNEAVWIYGTQVTNDQVFYTGINIRVSFDTYTPYFRCPFSTTIDWNVANRFSEGIGIVLKLQPEPSARDRYFNVEWLSNYKEERERLFCWAKRLRITDIQYSYKMEVQYNNLYLDAFRLWSAIFAGYYFIFTTNNRKKTEKMLVYLILNYKENNGLNSGVNGGNIDIPIYIQQLFYHFIHRMCQGNDIRLIPSEYLLLKKSLQHELLSLEPLTLSPFLESLDMKASSVECLEQYIWILTDEQLQKLKYGQKDAFVRSEQQHYKMKNTNNKVRFDLGILDQSSNIYT
eukprot:1036398_1